MSRRWLIVLLSMTLSGSAQAYVRAGAGVMPHGQHRLRLPAPPPLVGDGVTAGLDFNFVQSIFLKSGVTTATPPVTVTRASTKYCDDAAGTWSQVAVNTLCYTNKGALLEEARTNLLLNSQAPVTQTITVVSTGVYTASLYGTGTMTLSGAGTGVVSQGAPVTFTASTTSLTATMAGTGGAFVNAQVELGAFATSPIPTAGAAATRAADVVIVTTPPAMGASASLYASGTPVTVSANPTSQALFAASDGTNANVVRLVRQAASGLGGYIVRSANAALVSTQVASPAWSPNTFGKAALAYASGAQSFYFSGLTSITSAIAPPAGMTTLELGFNPAVSQAWNGYVSRLAVWPATALSTAALQSITSGSGP